METVTAKQTSKILEKDGKPVTRSWVSKLGILGKIKRIEVSPDIFEYDLDSVLKYKETRKQGRPEGRFKK
jgi:hypothetical protein